MISFLLKKNNVMEYFYDFIGTLKKQVHMNYIIYKNNI